MRVEDDPFVLLKVSIKYCLRNNLPELKFTLLKFLYIEIEGV